MTEDEAYYWLWSRHLDFGYMDHPPAVAWLIAAGSWLGHSALAIRLPFILCEGLAAIVVGLTVLTLSGSQRAASVGAIMFALIPQLRWTIGEALPDGPYVLCWAAALWFAARAAKKARLDDIVLLGIALGGALLSRFFAWALLGGIIAYSLMPRTRFLWRRHFWVAPLLAAILYVPFLVWNANHQWANFMFTLQTRHPMEGFSFNHLGVDSTVRYLLFAIAFCAVGYWATISERAWPLLAWTALPFPLALAALSFFQPVDSYWLLGPFASLCAGIGLAFDRLKLPVRALGAVGWVAAFGATVYVAAAGAWMPSARFGGESAIYAPLARDLLSVTRGSQTPVFANSYELASELVYYGLPVRLRGNSPQAREWSFWGQTPLPPRALLVLNAATPLERNELAHDTHADYRATAGPRLSYCLPGVQKSYDTYWLSSALYHHAARRGAPNP
ncbi:MAG TPA: glycosyltransferase family 39 protein [Candidatus Rubrimentiphilum sp.]|nr:glycosyltransferase family 39 protein [Candidatus Rubrimentiphilum sp.]